MEKENRKFRDAAEYQKEEKRYSLLPFRFHAVDSEREVLVNEIGDYLLVPSGTAGLIVGRKIDTNTDLYRDLVAKPPANVLKSSSTSCWNRFSKPFSLFQGAIKGFRTRNADLGNWPVARQS